MANEWTTEQLHALFDIPDQFLLQDANADMIAINRYISDTVAITPEAVKLKDSWIIWWNGLTWYQKNIASETFDEARNRRNAFFVANAPTEKEKDAVKQVIETGGTEEESEGKPRRTLSSGNFPGPPPAPLIPSLLKIGGAVAVLAGVAAGVASIVSKFNPVSLVTGAFSKKG
jgi:hypothetical protein